MAGTHSMDIPPGFIPHCSTCHGANIPPAEVVMLILHNPESKETLVQTAQASVGVPTSQTLLGDFMGKRARS